MTSAPPPSLPYTDPAAASALIAGVVARQLRVNRDPRGTLVETLKVSWTDCYDADQLPFAQSYYSYTEPWVARDEDRWHVHQHQADRFVVPYGDIVLALCDRREGSPTSGLLNLIRLGQSGGDEAQYLVLIPARVLHGFMVAGDRPALLINFPTRLYDEADEGRVAFREVGASLGDGRPFSWEAIREVERGASAARR